MAKLVFKSGKGKVIMLVSSPTYKLYRENLEIAHRLGYRLDCQEGFERWFRAEQKKIRQDLDVLSANAGSDKAPLHR